MSISKFLLAALLGVSCLVLLADAEIPAGYAGTPFPPGSAPRELKGRINFNEYDLGGKNVAWYQDDDYGGAPNRKNIDIAGPAFYATNGNTTDRDTFYAAGVVWPNGVRYPDPVDTMVQDCYIGASHANTWVKWTVHVPKAGKYWISSIWSAMEEPAHYRVMFLNGKDTVSTPLISFQQEASYHAWSKYSDFASVQLDTGVQVLFFQNGSNHLNQDFLYFATDSGQFTTGISRPASKAIPTGSFDLSINRETVRFTLPDAGLTKISVFNCLGREIGCVLNKSLGAGEHSALLPMANLKQGVYFLHLTHNAATAVMRFQAIGK